MQTLLMIFDILGTVAFAVSGAIVGVRRRMDILGVTVLAVVTATGGGILRDIMVGQLPPQALLHPRYVAISAAVGLICFFVMCFHPSPPQKAAAAYDMVMFCFDTLGVAAFTVDGGSITNTPGVVLPSTGGEGLNKMYTAGFLAVAIAVAGLALSLRRRQS